MNLSELEIMAATIVALTNLSSGLHTSLSNTHGQKVGGVIQNYNNYLDWLFREDPYTAKWTKRISGIPLAGPGVLLGTMYNKTKEHFTYSSKQKDNSVQ